MIAQPVTAPLVRPACPLRLSAPVLPPQSPVARPAAHGENAKQRGMDLPCAMMTDSMTKYSGNPDVESIYSMIKLLLAVRGSFCNPPKAWSPHKR